MLTLTLYLIFFINQAVIVQTCRSDYPVAYMCQNSMVQGPGVTLDVSTAATSGYNGCTCNVTSNTTGFTVDFDENPNATDCGATLDLLFDDLGIQLKCGVPALGQSTTGSSARVFFTRDTDVSNIDSDYCLSFHANRSDILLTLTCVVSNQPSSSSLPTTTSTPVNTSVPTSRSETSITSSSLDSTPVTTSSTKLVATSTTSDTPTTVLTSASQVSSTFSDIPTTTFSLTSTTQALSTTIQLLDETTSHSFPANTTLSLNNYTESALTPTQTNATRAASTTSNPVELTTETTSGSTRTSTSNNNVNITTLTTTSNDFTSTKHKNATTISVLSSTFTTTTPNITSTLALNISATVATMNTTGFGNGTNTPINVTMSPTPGNDTFTTSTTVSMTKSSNETTSTSVYNTTTESPHTTTSVPKQSTDANSNITSANITHTTGSTNTSTTKANKNNTMEINTTVLMNTTAATTQTSKQTGPTTTEPYSNNTVETNTTDLVNTTNAPKVTKTTEQTNTTTTEVYSNHTIVSNSTDSVNTTAGPNLTTEQSNITTETTDTNTTDSVNTTAGPNLTTEQSNITTVTTDTNTTDSVNTTADPLQTTDQTNVTTTEFNNETVISNTTIDTNDTTSSNATAKPETTTKGFWEPPYQDYDVPSRSKNIITILVPVAGVLLLVFIAVVVYIMCKRSRDAKRKTRIPKTKSKANRNANTKGNMEQNKSENILKPENPTDMFTTQSIGKYPAKYKTENENKETDKNNFISNNNEDEKLLREKFNNTLNGSISDTTQPKHYVPSEREKDLMGHLELSSIVIESDPSDSNRYFKKDDPGDWYRVIMKGKKPRDSNTKDDHKIKSRKQKNKSSGSENESGESRHRRKKRKERKERAQSEDFSNRKATNRHSSSDSFDRTLSEDETGLMASMNFSQPRQVVSTPANKRELMHDERHVTNQPRQVFSSPANVTESKPEPVKTRMVVSKPSTVTMPSPQPGNNSRSAIMQVNNRTGDQIMGNHLDRENSKSSSSDEFSNTNPQRNTPLRSSQTRNNLFGSRSKPNSQNASTEKEGDTKLEVKRPEIVPPLNLTNTGDTVGRTEDGFEEFLLSEC